MKRTVFLRYFVICIVLSTCQFSDSFAQSKSSASITVTVDPAADGKIIPPDFSGLSFETEKILAGTDGKYYFSPSNKALIATLKTIGVKNLRIGGNTSDNPAVASPTERDVDTVFAFAKAAGVKLIYTVRLKKGDPQVNATMAKYIYDRYKSELLCLAIGNEPSAFGKDYTYEKYRDEWRQHMEAIVALVPDAKFCGANVHKRPEWATQFAKDFSSTGKVMLITMHLYPGSSAYTKPDAATLRDDETPNKRVPKDGPKSMKEMLSPAWVDSYQSLYKDFGPAIASMGLPYRMEEVNNFFHGGLQGASDRFAATLWGLDFMYWWASHDAAGLNFHTGEMVAAGDNSTICRYATFLKAADGYEVKPLGYGIKAFDLGSHGKLLPAQVTNTGNLNVRAYTVLGDDKNLYVTLINKEYGASAPEITVNIASGNGYKQGQIISLTAPNADISSETGLQLGGSGIKNDAAWQGTWKKIDAPKKGVFKIKLPAASAAVIKLSL